MARAARLLAAVAAMPLVTQGAVPAGASPGAASLAAPASPPLLTAPPPPPTGASVRHSPSGTALRGNAASRGSVSSRGSITTGSFPDQSPTGRALTGGSPSGGSPIDGSAARAAIGSAPPASAPAASTPTGDRLSINGTSQQALWLWRGDSGLAPQELWLPLEVLENQLGVSSRSRPDGGLELEWYGLRLQRPAAAQRSLEDEVAVEVLELLQQVGVQIRREGRQLTLQLARPRLLGVRSSAGGQRVVLDLAGPAVARRSEQGLSVDLQARPDQLAALQALGLRSRLVGEALQLALDPQRPGRSFTLGTPARLVLDRPAAGGGDGATAPADPRLQALLGSELHWDRLLHRGIRINAVRLDPRSSSLRLRPLASAAGMQGLQPLTQLAQGEQALVAINGGFFNRVRRLPLGALRSNGRWLSGPILNRGVVAWEERGLPRFGRLRLEEWVSDGRGRRLALVALNSGYVQRGISRYTADWGPGYRALSGNETGLLLQNNRVDRRLGSRELEQGVALAPGTTLLVARGGAELPWGEGEALSFSSRPSDPLGRASFVLGGGPLLLQNGRNVLNGSAEGFSPAFLSQGAPRTVVASDGRQIWLLTLQGTQDSGPTLGETASLLQQLGLRDALNLDGGSSTGLVMGGALAVKGRGVAGSVHNGLGLVP